MGAGAVEVGESGEDRWQLYLCASENIVDEGGKRRVVATALEGMTPCGRAAECGIDGSLDYCDEVVCDHVRSC